MFKTLAQVVLDWKINFIEAIMRGLFPAWIRDVHFDKGERAYEHATLMTKDNHRVEARFRLEGDNPDKLFLCIYLKFPDKEIGIVQFKSEETGLFHLFVEGIGTRDTQPIIKKVAEAVKLLLGYPSTTAPETVRLGG